MSNKVWSISQLVNYLKQQLTNDFVLRNISVEGEIGNFTNHFSGHWYFTLKDKGALINCAMFKGYNQTVDFLPKNGDSLICSGNVSIFEKSGQLQIIVTSMKLAGAGDFYKQFALMKAKLEPLGYFDLARKKPIPKFPKQISVITGANTAALQDILTTVSSRWPVKIIEVNAIVQGTQAIDSVVKALEIADKQGSDTIILARGGGSVDDLWCFNDEKIAKAIYQCQTPIITGIGHEIDTTIADLVADLRAPTPTGAACYATPDYKEVQKNLFNYQSTIIYSFKYKIERYYQELDYYTTKLQNYSNKLVNLNNQIAYDQKLIALALKNNLANYKIKNENLTQALIKGKEDLLIKKNNLLVQNIQLLDSLSPLKIMSRGYIISKQNDKVLKSIKDVDKNANITLQYVDGSLKVQPVEEEV